ncbi:MAG TPA: class I SAM-dependent methyltransferase [Candidatus Elarobacter sp.]|nr:class I SAM-dependent methyltransferase [Candidatus Elarobacter sp.]
MGNEDAAAARFAGRALDYDRYRPRYAGAAINAILDGFSAPVVADVGSGTGIASRALRDAGARVIAVEPNAEMRALIVAGPGLDVRAGSAERTGLDDAAVDIVTVFQAFHWFDARRALDEFARILKPGGRLAIVYPGPLLDDMPSAAWQDLVSRHGEAALVQSLTTVPSMTRIQEDARFRDFRRLVFETDQKLDRVGLQGRVRGLSHVPLGGPECDAALANADRLFACFAVDGTITIKYRNDVLLGQRVSDGAFL